MIVFHSDYVIVTTAECEQWTRGFKNKDPEKARIISEELPEEKERAPPIYKAHGMVDLIAMWVVLLLCRDYLCMYLKEWRDLCERGERGKGNASGSKTKRRFAIS